jgi:very-short-patch-repair endonuclease
MAQGPVAVPTAGIDGFVKTAIQQYRAKLLDLSSRNPLVNFRHSEKSRSHIRIIDEIPEKLFEKLDAGRQLWFEPLPDPVLIPPDEDLPLFHEALRKAKRTDDLYRKCVEELGPVPSDRKRQRVERELRNRVRSQLGLATYEVSSDPKKRAIELGIIPDYDLPKTNGQNRRKHIDQNVQTLFFRDDLNRKLGGLRESTRSLLQDAGLSALYCAFGFLEYYESTDSDEKRVAPLLFYPIEMDRELQDGEYRYFITGRNEDVEVNVVLRELLKREYSLELPAWTPEEDDTDPLGNFLGQVESIISSRRDWKVRRYVTTGLFTFSTLVMYNDLDPERWPRGTPLHERPVLRTLIAGTEVHGSGVAPDYEIDHVNEPTALLITDADSSQHSAVIDVLKGKNTVVQGPPGTGKSQTLTNIISAALYSGKTILFVAEKMAALEVVKKRLDASGIGPFCLEVHSSKTSKSAIVQSLNSRLEHTPRRPQQVCLQNNLEAIEKARQELIYYVEKTNESAGKTGFTVRDVLLGSAMRENARSVLPEAVSKARFADPLSITPHFRHQMRDAASNLERQLVPLKVFGSLAANPWRGLQNCELTELDSDSLVTSFKVARSDLAELLRSIEALEKISGSELPQTFEKLASLITLAQSLPNPKHLEDDGIWGKLGSAECRQTVARIIGSINARSEAKQRIKEYATDSDTAVFCGSKHVDSALFYISRLKCADLSIPQLEARINELRERISVAQRCRRVGNELSAAFTLQRSSLHELSAAVKALELLDTLPRDLWLHRSGRVLEESNRKAIKAAANTVASLRNRRRLLEAQWTPDLIPGPATLKQYVIALRTTNWLTGLFNEHCRSAKTLIKAARIDGGKLEREELAKEYSKWAQLQEDEQKFNTNLELSRTLGDLFRGLETDFTVLEQVADWAYETRLALSKFGNYGRELCLDLFGASQEELSVKSNVKEMSSFAEFKHLLETRDDNDSATLADFITETENKYAEFDQLLQSVISMSFAAERPLSEMTGLARQVKEFEKQQSSIVHDSAQLQFQQPDMRLEVLIATLDFADAISRSGLPPDLQVWLHQHMGNESVLRREVQGLKERLERAALSVEGADRLAKFDWDLWCKCDKAHSAEVEALQYRFTEAIEHTSALQEFLNFLLAEDSACETGLGPVLNAFASANEDYRDLVTAVDFVFYRSAAEQILNADPRLRRHSGSSHDQLRTQYQQLDKEFIDLRRQLLACRLSERAVPTGVYQGRVADLTELALVQHVAGQVRPRIALRELFRRAGRAIQGLTPCWMMSPMSVAQFLEPGNLQFDLVLMDEASQIRPEEALGAVARGGQVVVVGDQMQLPPTSFFQRLSTDGASDDEEELEDVQQESVLEAAAARFYPPRMLKWHYRSEHGSLISFSNYEFYGDELTVFPSPFHDHPEYGIKLHQVDGVYGAGTNEIEARAVVDEAAKFMASHPVQSLGIVAVNSKQADLIRELIDQLCASNPDAEAYRAKWSTNLESLFVKNLENVQGDERDVIFVSTVYGKDKSGNFYQRFGPINSTYGHRRLNVLFTRAKKKLAIFSSMRYEQIQDEGKSWGVRALKGYLQFASTGSWLQPTTSGMECDSEFEEWVLNALRANGYEAVPQLGFAGYRIDIAVRHPKEPGTFLCGIECDGATYHSARSVRERDRLRQEVLERLGWSIYRIWSTDWFRNPSLQTRNLVAHLKKLGSQSRD